MRLEKGWSDISEYQREQRNQNFNNTGSVTGIVQQKIGKMAKNIENTPKLLNTIELATSKYRTCETDEDYRQRQNRNL